MSKDNPKINNQNDIDNYINQLIKQAESEIETLFSRRLKANTTRNSRYV